MFCTECGTRNSADSKYCKECGHKVNDGYRAMMLSIEDLRAVEDEHNQERLTKLLDMAFWHNQAGNLEAAVLACEAALMIHPNCTTAHSLLGTLYEKKDEDAKAIEHFEAVVRLNPDSAADAAKLDQLRRGVHVKAVTPPPSYKWLPPVLVGMTWAKAGERFRALSPGPVSAPAFPDRLRKPLPIIAAGAAALLVLIVGLMLLRPAHTTRTATIRTIVSPMPTAGNPVASSPYGGANAASGEVANSLPAPIVLPPGPAAANQGGGKVAVAAPPDPFSEALKPGTKTTPLIRPGHRAHTARVASLPRDSGLGLPALSLKAVPLSGDGGLAPAPVFVSPEASATGVPQHTVVVPSLGGGSAGPPPPSSGYGSPAASGDMASHIHITINDNPADNSVTISDHATPRPAAHRTEQGGGQDGDAYQQTALSLQQQGDFRRARAAYQQAIRAYKSEIASGHNADAAGQGLAASQTGLQICEQSRQ